MGLCLIRQNRYLNQTFKIHKRQSGHYLKIEEYIEQDVDNYKLWIPPTSEHPNI